MADQPGLYVHPGGRGKTMALSKPPSSKVESLAGQSDAERRFPFADKRSAVLNDLCYTRYDRYPVNPGHLLVVPFRHVAEFFDATDDEQAALLALVREAKWFLDGRFHPDGYNIGVNVGQAAGQTVMHVHVHVIPRYAGDVEDPRGGVRGVIPERRGY